MMAHPVVTMRLHFLSKFCHMNLQCPIMIDDTSCKIPKLIMIGARPLEERRKAFESWMSYNVIFYNATGQCRKFCSQYFVLPLQLRSDPYFSIGIKSYFYTGLSKHFNEHNAECSKTDTQKQNLKFHAQRVFYVYKEVFRTVLVEYQHDKDFIFIEDDAKIVNFRKFHSEVCSAGKNELQFYSFYHTDNQVSSTNLELSHSWL